MAFYFVTGGGGFIGSNLVDRLLDGGNHVTVYDNFVTGQHSFLEKAVRNSNCRIIQGDTLDLPRLTAAMHSHDCVFHLAANADVRHGVKHPRKDLEQNTIATHNVLQAMCSAGVSRIAFASTGAVYGEPTVFPTPENCPFPVQTSLYGASKMACEGLISAFANAFGMTATIFRFVSILGPRYSHGHVYDFFRQLRTDPTKIHVLGDGSQRKSYLHVEDCVDAMLVAVDRPESHVNIFNLGAQEFCTVNESLQWICEKLGVTPNRHYTGGPRGWIGDSPMIFLDTRKIRSLGWHPKHSIRQSIENTVAYLQGNSWLLERRPAAA